jgi:signal peptide peptidase SppA
MTLEKLQAIGAVLTARAAGVAASPDEIRAALGGSAAAPASRSVGSTAVIPIFGALAHRMGMFSEFSGGTSYTAVRAALRGALTDTNVSSILLEIDSPGGNVDGLPELADEIYAARGQKPIGAIANTLSASAAYWLGSQVDDFAVTPSGVVGSVGVYMMHIDESQMNEKVGLAITYISAGEHKTEGNPDEPLSEDARGYLQSQVDAIYGQFIAAVARGRGAAKKAVRETYGQGRVLMAEPALKVGMVDRIATLDEMVSRMASKGKRAMRVSMASTASADVLVEPSAEVSVDRQAAIHEAGEQVGAAALLVDFDEAPGRSNSDPASGLLDVGGIKTAKPNDASDSDGELGGRSGADEALLAAARITAELSGA